MHNGSPSPRATLRASPCVSVTDSKATKARHAFTCGSEYSRYTETCRTPYLHRIRTRFISLNRLTLPWRLTMGALSRRCRHETATVLAGNHHNLFHNNFPRCGNLSLLQWLMNPHKINDHEDHRQAKNKEQRNKNNPKRIHDSTSPQHDYRIYEPQLSKRASSPVVLHQSIHPPIAHNIDACRCSTSFIPPPTCRFTIDSSFFRRSHLWKEQVREP